MKAMTVPSPPTPLPQAGEGRFLSRWRDFHINPSVNTDRLQATLAGSLRRYAAPAAGYLARWAAKTSRLLHDINHRK